MILFWKRKAFGKAGWQCESLDLNLRNVPFPWWPEASSVQSLTRVWLCDLMNSSTLGLPVHHQLLEFTQIHGHRVSDAIQPSHPRSSLSPPAPIPPSIRVFSNELTLRMRWPKHWSFTFSIILPKKSQGWSPSEWTGWISLQSKGLSRVFSNTTV